MSGEKRIGLIATVFLFALFICVVSSLQPSDALDQTISYGDSDYTFSKTVSDTTETYTITRGNETSSYDIENNQLKTKNKISPFTSDGLLLLINNTENYYTISNSLKLADVKVLVLIGKFDLSSRTQFAEYTNLEKADMSRAELKLYEKNATKYYMNALMFNKDQKLKEIILSPSVTFLNQSLANTAANKPTEYLTSLEKIVVTASEFNLAYAAKINYMENLKCIEYTQDCNVDYAGAIDFTTCPNLVKYLPDKGDIKFKLREGHYDSVNISSNITQWTFLAKTIIDEITIDQGNQNYMLYDGAVYQILDTGLQLVYVPPNKETLEIPGNTVNIPESYLSPDTTGSAVSNSRMFSQNSNLKSIFVKSGAAFQIHDYMFMYNSSLESIHFENSCFVQSIGSNVFNGSATGQDKSIILRELVNVPKTVVSIGERAFYGCTCLEKVTFESGSQLASIGNEAFYGCISLGTLTVPSTTALGTNVFSKCTMLENVVTTGTGQLSFCDGLIIDGDSVYYALPRWESVRIPSNVTSIGEGAFSENTAQEILVDDANTTYAVFGSVVTSKDGSTLVLVPNGSSIVNIPSEVKTIPTKAFENSIARTVYWKSTGDLTVEQYALSNSHGLSNIKQLTIITDGNLSIGKQYKLPITKLKLECSTLTAGAIDFTKPFTADLNVNANEGNGFLNENVKKVQIENKTLAVSVIRSLFCTDTTYGEISITQYIDSGWNKLDEVSVLTGHRLNVSSDIDGFESSLLEILLNSNGDPEVTFSFSTPEGIGSVDVTALVGEEELNAADNVYTVVLSSDKTVTIAEKDAAAESVTVTFVYGNDIENKVEHVGKDRTLRNSVIASASSQVLNGYTFDGWYTTSTLEVEYVPGAVSADLELFAKWSSNSGFVVTIEDVYGLVVKKTDSDVVLRSGDRVDSGTAITVTYTVPQGFDFLGWKINDGLVDDTDSASNVKTKSLTVEASTDIGVSYRYYSTSNSLINQVATTMPTDDIALRWSYSGEIDATMNIWTGFPSIPLIVDDNVYIRVNNDLMRIDIATGEVVGSVRTDNSTVTAYYHYLGYGNGYVFDYATHNIYSTDLSKSCPMDRSYTAVFYDSGSYFGLIGSTVYRFGIIESDNSFSVSPYESGGWNGGVSTNWFAIYGTTSSPVFANGKIYFIESSGDSRSISYIDIESGDKESFTDAKWNGKLMDDGWLTYAEVDGEKYLFTTMYNVGLFSSADGQTWVVCVKLNNDGTFANNWRYVNLSETGQETGTAGSAFVVFQDRGYVNAHGSMFVFDVKKILADSVSNSKVMNASNDLIYVEKSVSSHGSIVLNVSEYDRTGNVYVYLLPYNPSDQAVYIFTDNAQKTSASGYFKTSPAGASYGSQAVRAGPNSELLWYTDTGKLYCYAPMSENVYTFFVDYGDKSAIYQASGLNQSDALMDALDSCDVTYNIDPIEGITSINTISNSTETYTYWSLYKKVESGWDLADIYSADDSDCHTFLIHYGGSSTQGSNLDTSKQWIYQDDAKKARVYDLESPVPANAAGKTMALLGITDNSTTVSGSSVSSTIVISLPLEIDSKVKVYAKFSDNSFMQYTTKVTMIDGIASFDLTMCGNSTPERLLISVLNSDGDQLKEYRVNLASA